MAPQVDQNGHNIITNTGIDAKVQTLGGNNSLSTRSHKRLVFDRQTKKLEPEPRLNYVMKGGDSTLREDGPAARQALPVGGAAQRRRGARG